MQTQTQMQTHADADADADKDHNDKVNSKELPDTGNENNGTLFVHYSLRLEDYSVGRRRKTKIMKKNNI